MRNSIKSRWATVLFSGLGVAAFGFIANTAWELYRHRTVGPEYVNASLRFEDDTLLLFVRNNSDEPLDLVRARIEITNLVSEPLGAYPDISKLYQVSSTADGTELEVVNETLVVKLHITQAIEPREADNFGVKLQGLFGPVNLSKGSVRAILYDNKQNTYIATY